MGDYHISYAALVTFQLLWWMRCAAVEVVLKADTLFSHLAFWACEWQRAGHRLGREPGRRAWGVEHWPGRALACWAPCQRAAEREKEGESGPDLRCCSAVCLRALIAPRAVGLLVERAWLRSMVHVALTGRERQREEKEREQEKGYREAYWLTWRLTHWSWRSLRHLLFLTLSLGPVYLACTSCFLSFCRPRL